ncbi:MAG: hypothetical protein ABSG17_21090 [Spirochaetia bacterium]|jgi:hypothetical protein
MKMVKVCLILALIMGGSSLLFSQEAPTLTPDQQDQFDSQKLTVTGYKIVTVSRYGGVIGDSGFGPSSTNWDASKGYDKISEPDFLRTLGLDKEALESQSHQTSKSLLTGGGWGAAVVGLLIMFVPVVSPPMTTDQYGLTSLDMGAFWTYLGIGAAISIGGTVMILAGSNMSPNITPYGRAAALAEKYNTQLLIKITGKDPNKPRTPDNGST